MCRAGIPASAVPLPAEDSQPMCPRWIGRWKRARSSLRLWHPLGHCPARCPIRMWWTASCSGSRWGGPQRWSSAVGLPALSAQRDTRRRWRSAADWLSSVGDVANPGCPAAPRTSRWALSKAEPRSPAPAPRQRAWGRWKTWSAAQRQSDPRRQGQRPSRPRPGAGSSSNVPVAAAEPPGPAWWGQGGRSRWTNHHPMRPPSRLRMRRHVSVRHQRSGGRDTPSEQPPPHGVPPPALR
jgi:hypothetical protein